MPARRDPRLPDKAQPSMLHAKVPRGKPGRNLLSLMSLQRARTPKGLNNRLIDVSVSSKKNKELIKEKRALEE